MQQVLEVAIGITGGALAAWLHLWLSWRAAKAALERQTVVGALVGMPLRVGAAAGALWLLAWVGPWAVLAGAGAFALTHRLSLAKWRDAGKAAAR